MPNAEEFLKSPLRYFVGLIAEPGAGKTRAAIGFPRNYFIEVGDTYGLKTVLADPKNAALRPNLVHHQSLDIEQLKEAKEIFRTTDKPTDLNSIFGILAHVKQLAKEGAIDTVTFDGSSFLADMKGADIGKGAGSLDGDKWSYYRQLKNDLTWFMNANVMPLVSRYNLNVVLAYHVQREGDESKQKQTTRDADWAPRVEGGFRQSLSALPRAMIYLHQSVELRGTEQTIKYSAFCQRVKVPHVGLVPAKNSYGLPPVLDITNKSLYEILVQSTTAAAPRAATAVTK